MDRDYLDDRHFPPPEESPGSSSSRRRTSADSNDFCDASTATLFHAEPGTGFVALPLEGSKLQVFPEFGAAR